METNKKPIKFSVDLEVLQTVSERLDKAEEELAEVKDLLYLAMNDCAFDVANWVLYKELQEWYDKHEAKMTEEDDAA